MTLASVGTACAMMAKGPIGLIIIASALGSDLLLKRKWSDILKWQWLPYLVLTLVLMGPMLYGLYTQFDLHPEKQVYGLDGPSGIEFFFWTQSFGRITGDIYWSNDAGYFFFFHSILWDFQPWILLFIPALILRLIAYIKGKFRLNEQQEVITTFGFLLPFLALSMSNYKLPHYIFPLLPFASIITADFLSQLGKSGSRWSRRIPRIQLGFMHLFFLAIPVFFLFMFSPRNWWVPVVASVAYIVTWVAFTRIDDMLDKIVIPTSVAMIAFGLVMSLEFYPSLLQFQGATQLGKELNEEYPVASVYHFPGEEIPYSLDYYAQRVVDPFDGGDCDLLIDRAIIFVRDRDLRELRASCAGPDLNIIASVPDYRVTKLKADFLMRSSRESQLDSVHLVLFSD